MVVDMNLTYPVVSDSFRNHIREYGVIHPTEGISRPAVFIIDKEGRIAWQYVGTDASDRPSADRLLNEVKAVK